MLKRFMRLAALASFLPLALLATGLHAQMGPPPQAPPGDIVWHLDDAATGHAHDDAGNHDDPIQGYGRSVAGIHGPALAFDGYTTHLEREGSAVPRLGNAFTVSAWVALDSYPWNWAPIADQSEFDQIGYFFGIDALGHLGFSVSVDGVWQRLISERALPLKKWSRVTAVFDGSQGLRLYVNGEPAGELAVRGRFWQAAEISLLVGRVRQPTVPFPAWQAISRDAVNYALDGYLSDLAILNHAATQAEETAAIAATPVPAADAMPWARMPSGPEGAGPFAAFYASLAFTPSWDHDRRIGKESDVVVRFEHSPMRLVFWQGLNYVPAWRTADGKWYTNEFMETWGEGCPGAGDCEPMSDKQSRYSHVSILASSEARARIHWRYSLMDARTYLGGHPDPLTGWWDWADEYWTVYPDGVAVRRQVLHSSAIDSKPHEWQESIILHDPGQRPEDNIWPDAVTLVNMQGQTHSYSWQPHTDPRAFTFPNGPDKLDQPAGANIQYIHLKSVEEPFQVVWQHGVSFDTYNFSRSYAMFTWWNHWPVAQIGSSERQAVAPDRPSHSSVSHIYWDPVDKTAGTETKLLLCGLTREQPAGLVPLAKSWLEPAAATVDAGLTPHYEAAERAWVLDRVVGAPGRRIQMRLAASAAQPVINPAVVVRNWSGQARVEITIGGKKSAVAARLGMEQDEGVSSLVVYAPLTATEPVEFTILAR